jgi:muramoyltetrapeptide carboxypeptidase
MLSRRSFLRGSGAAAALSLGTLPGLKAGGQILDREPVQRILPKRLKKGHLVGLVTPGSPVTELQLGQAILKLEEMELRTTYDDSVLSEYGYFAGTDRERADELMRMFSRPEVDAIWCVRGGYGSIRILDLLDYSVIRENPKILVGYSDITALHAAIFRETGLVTYHGPLGISDFNRFSVRSLRSILMEPEAPHEFPYRREKEERENPEYERYTIYGGQAEGWLTGGNISVLDSLIGTRFEPDFGGRIAYLEETEEKTYRVDKMLFHLLSATSLKQAAGIMLGVFRQCNVNDEPRLTLKQAIGNLLGPLGIPVSYGHAFGHISRMLTLPNGIRASLDADRNSLVLLEEASGP